MNEYNCNALIFKEEHSPKYYIQDTDNPMSKPKDYTLVGYFKNISIEKFDEIGRLVKPFKGKQSDLVKKVEKILGEK